MGKDKITFITNVKIFDGECVIEKQSVTVKGEKIVNIGGPAPDGAEVIDAKGCTLLPGLIDAHTHADPESRKIALTFGVTTVYIMQGYWSKEQKRVLDKRRDIADALSSFFAVTAPGGHPHELIPKGAIPKMPQGFDMSEAIKFASTPEEAAKVVAKRVEQDANYIKIMVEDGTVFGKPGTPDITDEVLTAACAEAHRFGKMAVAHTMTIKASERAIKAGIDGLMHIFIDKPYTKEIIDTIVNSGVFVCPTIVAGASTIGDSDAGEFAKDERVCSKLSEEWINALHEHINSYPQGKTEYLLETVKALHDDGVDILAGADSSTPDVSGMVPGASLHHELQLLVKAGLTPIEVLRAATSVPARRFGLIDRGRIVDGARADLLLVKGDPTSNISDTLSVQSVWRQGVRLTTI
ncbi:amidohydrolase family protein [Clostridium kluyveri]|uniref:amidohydrolase family protein n=1 Tax=Clostridium kluyveri TaxID=1534 RepID=UPI0022468E28|nr:amidohydrolase family protein [Clostridium kluyveri]UZQ50025.1 amidohydrolase family protein [Clostridium kluyveri]